MTAADIEKDAKDVTWLIELLKENQETFSNQALFESGPGASVCQSSEMGTAKTFSPMGKRTSPGWMRYP